MERCLQEFRIRGVKTNIPFLISLDHDPTFLAGNCTTRFIDETPELFEFTPRRDRATKLLQYIGDVIVNGQASVKDAPRATRRIPAQVPTFDTPRRCPRARATSSKNSASRSSAQWVREQKPLLLTDTTMRDAHQSLLATRVRTYDLLEIADAYARNCAGLFSLEMWGGATFDTSMRFLKESPWQRLEQLRERIPNILFQMLLRASNAMGYANYPDNVVRECVREAAAAGMDVFRIFDALNWTPNMRVAMEATHRDRRDLRSGHLLHGRHPRPAAAEVQPEVLRRSSPKSSRSSAHTSWPSRTWPGCASRTRRPSWSKRFARNRHADPLPHARHRRRAGRGDPQRGRGGPRHRRRRDGIDVGRHVAAESEHARRRPAEHAPRRQSRRRSARRHLRVLARGPRVLHAVRKPRARRRLDLYQHEMPGGQYTNLYQQATALGLVVALARSLPDLRRRAISCSATS